MQPCSIRDSRAFEKILCGPDSVRRAVAVGLRELVAETNGSASGNRASRSPTNSRILAASTAAGSGPSSGSHTSSASG